MGRSKNICKNSWEWSLKHLNCTLSFWSKKKRRKVIESDGFLTKTDQLVNYKEWHALSYGLLITSMAFLVSPVFMALNVWILYVITTTDLDKESNSRMVWEVGRETPYFLAGIIIVIVSAYSLGLPFDNGMEQVLIEIISEVV